MTAVQFHSSCRRRYLHTIDISFLICVIYSYQSFLFDAFSRSSGDIASVSRRDTGHVPLAGITQVPVGENHAFSIETEVAVNVVLLRKINPMNRVPETPPCCRPSRKRKIRSACPRTPKKGYGESAASVAACSAGSWKRSSLISSMWPESCSFSPGTRTVRRRLL